MDHAGRDRHLMRVGARNHLTDVAGLRVGHAQDAALRSGVSVVTFDHPAVAAVDIRGGAPGARETELLALENTVQTVDALTLSGGSAFGLDAAGGVMAALRAAGRGFALGDVRVPIAPAAILFDLANGGDKDWGLHAPYRDLGLQAAQAALAGGDDALGSVGAGFGATLGVALGAHGMRGGLGAASAIDRASGATVGALVAVNALGAATVGDGPQFWAAPFECGAEFGGLGFPVAVRAEALTATPARGPCASTTIAIVATDAALTKPQCRRLAVMAQDGLARALHPAHTPLDGDLVFAAATARGPAPADPVADLARLGALGALTLARAVARGVWLADSAADAPGLAPAWRDLFGR